MNFLVLLSALAVIGISAQAADGPLAGAPIASAQDIDNPSWFGRWLDNVTKTQSRQPHWVTPLVTVTPRLEQEFRTDFIDQVTTPSHHSNLNFGNGKGLELIPFDPVEVIVNVPAYFRHNNVKMNDGFGDFSLLLKYRLLAAPEEEGNYIVTAMLGVSLPTGSDGNGSPATIWTPQIAAGKGLGDFDVQTTFGVQLPDLAKVPRILLWNTAFQYHWSVARLWPEVEFNYSHWYRGADYGQNQLFVTPGLMFGRLPIYNRVAFTVGAGYQIALTSFHLYNHAGILSMRLPF